MNTLSLFVGAFLLLNSVITFAKYHWSHRSRQDSVVPPTYPSIFSVIEHIISSVWDNEKFYQDVTSYRGKPAAGRVGFFGYYLYFFQDRESIRLIWKTPSLSTPIHLQVYAMKYFFGVPEKTARLYRTDNSGPFRNPYPGTAIDKDKRLHFLSHQEFKRALSGGGMAPTFLRFRTAMEAQISEAKLASGEWTQHTDFRKFLRDVFAAPLIQSIYGPSLLRINPTFVDDLCDFDHEIPFLARGVPSFLYRKPHRLRAKLKEQMKRWHLYARQNFSQSAVYEDGDGDPFWGSAFMRNRHAMFADVGDHDEEAVAALDIGLCFGLVSNSVPATFLTLWHIFKDPTLLHRIREELREHLGSTLVREADYKTLSRLPLLQSVYAEVLRLYTNIYVMVSTSSQKKGEGEDDSGEDVALGRWSLPGGAIALLNSSVAHKDASFWNTAGGAHPAHSFWADRFLSTRQNPGSGPVNPELRRMWPVNNKKTSSSDDHDHDSSRPCFSSEGLEASYFPYGGGQSICPGRHLAKNVIITTAATMASEFDVEFLTDSLQLDKWRYGLGLAAPTNDIQFRIRRR
ncbi:cytochrome P450 [Xylariaceae sp. FL0594]|nr:cytochrome P450 [Xylariaceae sp. FL0594]